MAERVLSDDEVAKLGLDKPAPERALSDAEVSALGLDKPAPKRVPSPTGWKDAAKADSWSGLVDKSIAADERKMPAMWGALAAGAHGAANALEGPINGALEVLTAPPMNENGPLSPDDIRKRYVAKRDEIEAAQKPNLKDFPRAPVVGSVLAGAAGQAPTRLGRLAMGAMQGAAYGAGSSDADAIGKHDWSGLWGDAKRGAAIGLGGAALGEAAQAPGRWLANKALKLSDATHAAELAAKQEAADALVASTRGAYGGEVSAGNRALEVLAGALENPNADPKLLAVAEQFLASPEGAQLRNQVLKSTLGRAPDHLGRIQAARDLMTDAISANNPAKVAADAASAAEGKLGNLSGVTDRIAELARRNIPPVVGTAIGGPAGGAAGALVAGAMGKPGTILSNMLKSPSMFRPLVAGASVPMAAGQIASKATDPLAEYFGLLDEDKR